MKNYLLSVNQYKTNHKLPIYLNHTATFKLLLIIFDKFSHKTYFPISDFGGFLLSRSISCSRLFSVSSRTACALARERDPSARALNGQYIIYVHVSINDRDKTNYKFRITVNNPCKWKKSIFTCSPFAFFFFLSPRSPIMIYKIISKFTEWFLKHVYIYNYTFFSVPEFS